MPRSFSTAMLDEEKSLDITSADLVEVRIRSDGTVLWVNVDGTLALRVYRVKQITIEDESSKFKSKALVDLLRARADLLEGRDHAVDERDQIMLLRQTASMIEDKDR